MCGLQECNRRALLNLPTAERPKQSRLPIVLNFPAAVPDQQLQRPLGAAGLCPRHPSYCAGPVGGRGPGRVQRLLLSRCESMYAPKKLVGSFSVGGMDACASAADFQCSPASCLPAMRRSTNHPNLPLTAKSHSQVRLHDALALRITPLHPLPSHSEWRPWLGQPMYERHEEDESWIPPLLQAATEAD